MCGSSRRTRRGAGGLALGLLLAAAAPAAPQAPAASPATGRLHPMEVMGLMGVGDGQDRLAVILRSKEDRRDLIIFIDPFTAQGIALTLEGQQLPRPFTHDLMASMLRELNATLVKVVITDLRENTYFAAIHLRTQGRDIELDSRPSDAIALALRAHAPILAEDRVLQRAAQPPGPRGALPR